jgi:hypothetical protein
MRIPEIDLLVLVSWPKSESTKQVIAISSKRGSGRSGSISSLAIVYLFNASDHTYPVSSASRGFCWNLNLDVIADQIQIVLFWFDKINFNVSSFSRGSLSCYFLPRIDTTRVFLRGQIMKWQNGLSIVPKPLHHVRIHI